MKRPPASKLLQLIMVLVALVILGCESADIQTGTTTTTDDSSSSSGSNSNGTNPSKPNPNKTNPTEPLPSPAVTDKNLPVAPASALYTTIGKFTILEITPISGYTYTWWLSDRSLGNISPTDDNRVAYFPTRIPSSGAEEQIITVVGTSLSSAIKYRGTAKITHQAP